MNASTQKRPLALIILDGFGHRDSKEANAIAHAIKPNWDHLLATCPHTLISGSGRCVGLPDGQMGNSEVGHMNMGAGRIVYQDLTRIDTAIADGSFFQNDTLIKALQAGKAVHIMGLLSPGGVHSHERHWFALLELAKQLKLSNLYLHPFLDGRDTPPQSALSSLETLDSLANKLNCGKIASIIGRYYAMDRDHRYERVQAAYELLVDGKADYHATDVSTAINDAYKRGETDEFVKATSIQPSGATPITIHDGDTVIFMNFRADRARELTQAFIEPDFTGFPRGNAKKLAAFVSLCEYDSRFPIPSAFPANTLTHLFADIISEHHLTQLRIAETEKYAHVTFFFNGGIEKPFPLEERILIPSPKVATYDLQPEMSAYLLTERLCQEIRSQKFDVIICNFANADMVGHSGNFDATVAAIEAIDKCLGLIIKALTDVNGEAIITADHGNAEMMYDHDTQQPHTAHTTDPVPFVFFGRKAMIKNEKGKLSDIAPTMLYLMNIPQPSEMTGNSILKLV